MEITNKDCTKYDLYFFNVIYIISKNLYKGSKMLKHFFKYIKKHTVM